MYLDSLQKAVKDAERAIVDDWVASLDGELAAGGSLLRIRDHSEEKRCIFTKMNGFTHFAEQTCRSSCLAQVSYSMINPSWKAKMSKSQ